MIQQFHFCAYIWIKTIKTVVPRELCWCLWQIKERSQDEATFEDGSGNRGPLGGTSGVDNILFEFLVFIWLSSPFFFPGNSSVTTIIPCTLSYSLVKGVRSGWWLLGGPPPCFKRVVSVLWCAVGTWAQSKSSLYLKSSPMTSNCHLSWNLLTSKIWSWGFQ